MRYSGILYNDIAAAPGISVTFFTQGCPFRCKGCHNPETWDFKGGIEFTPDVLYDIQDKLHANGINRNFCLMGGEPLCPDNLFLSCLLISEIKAKSPETKIYVWTGYELDDLLKTSDKKLITILENSDYLITGPYVQELRDITLFMRGSSNQKIIDLKKIELPQI